MTSRRPSVATIMRRRMVSPDINEMLQLLERATGSAIGLKSRLADLLGCVPDTVSNWERGGKPSPVFVPRLVELERSLKARKHSFEDELKITAEPPTKECTLPLMANAVTVTVDGEQALLRFVLKVPGEEEARVVANLLVPRVALRATLAAAS